MAKVNIEKSWLERLQEEFDKPYFEGVFGDFVFPDGTRPKWETLSWLQKHFMQWFNKEREQYVLTFPVETMALLTDGGDDFMDKEYADFTAQMWADGHSFFCYLSDSPDSLSSCCRLRNSLKDLDNADEAHNHTTHQYSMGTASVSTGSKSVMSMNLPRLIQNATRKYFKSTGWLLEDGKNIKEQGLKYDKEKLYEYIRNEVRELTERVHKYQTAFNETIKDFLEAKMLDVYDAGFIDMKKQYLTVGVNGITDAAEFLGIQVSVNDEYKEFVRKHNGLDCLCEYILRVGNHIQPAAYSMNNIFDFEHFDVCNPMPHHIIPFSPDGYGNHYCFDMQNNGKIIFWQHDIDYSDRVPEVVYESMLEMIREVFIDWNELNIDTPLQ